MPKRTSLSRQDLELIKMALRRNLAPGIDPATQVEAAKVLLGIIREGRSYSTQQKGAKQSKPRESVHESVNGAQALEVELSQQDELAALEVLNDG
jgi:hypothetical protein